MKKEFHIGRKLIGTLDGDTFYKEVLPSKHLFRVLDGWGVDSQTLHKLKNGTKVKIYDLEGGLTYVTTKEVFLELGEYYHFRQPREDYKTQLFLKREHFTIETPPILTPDEQAHQYYKKFL